MVSKYLLNKFLYTIDRDPDLVERYRDDPRGTVDWWEAEYDEPLAFQRDFGARLRHWTLPYPDIST
jgi:hypothetical protein